MDRGLQEALNIDSDEHQAIARGTPGLIDGMERIVAEAVAEGTVRADLQWPDLVMCMCALGHVIQYEDSMPGTAERLLEIQLDGLDPRPPR